MDELHCGVPFNMDLTHFASSRKAQSKQQIVMMMMMVMGWIKCNVHKGDNSIPNYIKSLWQTCMLTNCVPWSDDGDGRRRRRFRGGGGGGGGTTSVLD